MTEDVRKMAKDFIGKKMIEKFFTYHCGEIMLRFRQKFCFSSQERSCK